MRKRILVPAVLAGLAVAVVLGGHVTVAKDAPKPDDLPRLRSAEWMAKLKADDLVGFFVILETDPIATVTKPNEGMKQTLKLQRDEFAKHQGRPIGDVELVRTETIGKSFLRLTYLDKFERHAMLWQFVFYRNADGWKLQGLTWNFNSTVLFAEGK